MGNLYLYIGQMVARLEALKFEEASCESGSTVISSKPHVRVAYWRVLQCERLGDARSPALGYKLQILVSFRVFRAESQ